MLTPRPTLPIFSALLLLSLGTACGSHSAAGSKESAALAVEPTAPYEDAPSGATPGAAATATNAEVTGAAPASPAGQLVQNGSFAQQGAGWTSDGNVVVLPNAAEPGGYAARLSYDNGTPATLSQNAPLPKAAGYVVLRYDEAFGGNPNLLVTMTTSAGGAPTGQVQSTDTVGGAGGHASMAIAATDTNVGLLFQVGASAAGQLASPAGTFVELTHISVTYTADPNGL